VVGDCAGQGHVDPLCDAIFADSHISFLLLFVDLSDDAFGDDGVFRVQHGELVSVVHGGDAEREAAGFGVGPEVAFVVVFGFPCEGQPLSVAHPYRLQGTGLIPVEVLGGSHPAYAIPEAGADTFVNKYT